MSVTLGAPADAGVVQGSYSAATSEWVRHEGVYTVPAGQTTTKFAFSAVSTGSGDQSVGNFIDDVSFGSGPCLIASSTVANITTPGGELRVGDTLEATTTVKNIGGSLALTSAVAGVVPGGVEFIPGSIIIGGTTRSDASGDDQGEYTAASRTVFGRFGLGSSATAGGSIAPEESLTLKFRAVVQPGTAGASGAYGASASYSDSLAPQWGQSSTAPPITSTIALGADVTVATLATPTPSAGNATPSAWTFTVTNNGPKAAVGVRTTVTLPASLTVTSVTRTDANAPATTTADCTVVTATTRLCDTGASTELASGQSRTITVRGTFPLATPAGPAVVTADVASTVTAAVYDHNLANNSATNSAMVTAESVAPSSPTNVATDTSTTAQNTITWMSSTDNVAVTLYQVFRDGVLVGSTAPASLTFTDTGRTAGVAHVYSVRAGDAAGNFSALSTYSGAMTRLDPAQTYRVGHASAAQCLTAGSANVDAPLQIAGCSTSTLHDWKFIATDAGYYNVINIGNATRGWSLTSDTTNNGSLVIIGSEGALTNDRAEWIVRPEVTADGTLKSTVTFVNRYSGACLFVPGTANTTQLQQFTCSGGASQSFALTKKL